RTPAARRPPPRSRAGAPPALRVASAKRPGGRRSMAPTRPQLERLTLRWARLLGRRASPKLPARRRWGAILMHVKKRCTFPGRAARVHATLCAWVRVLGPGAAKAAPPGPALGDA